MEPTEIVLSLTRSFKEPLIKAFDEIKDEIVNLLDDSFPIYIESFRAKFLNTKTFLFRDQKVNFHKTYFPVTLKKGKDTFKIESLESLYKNGYCTTIIGNAGSGKSMQMKYLFLKALDQKIKIPIFIELKSLNDFEGELTQYIYSKILNNKLSPSTKILERILTSGKFIFLLDGYDELYSKNKQKITSDLEEFIDKYNRNWFVITSRPGSGIESFPRFSNNYVQPLKENEINEFIDMQCEVIDDLEFGVTVKQTISESKNDTYKDYLNSPLLLSMFLFTYKNHPLLPKQKSKFYWNVFDTLSTRHDSFTKKGAWQHERRSLLREDEIETILKWFSYITLFQGTFQFEIGLLYDKLNQIKNSLNLEFDNNDLLYDLSVNLGILQIDALYYKFPHKTLQEYFAAKLISEQKEEGKKKIYQDKLPILMENTINGGLNNFWELCSELDEINFTELFLFKYIDELCEGLSSKDLSIKYKKYYTIIPIRYLFDSDNKFLYGQALNIYDNYVASFLEFIDLENLESKGFEIIMKIPINDIIDQIKFVNSDTYYKNGEELKRKTRQIDPLENQNVLFPVLAKHGFDKVIENSLDDIMFRKEELKLDLLKLKKATIDLLDV